MGIFIPFLQVFICVIPATLSQAEDRPIFAAVVGGNNAEPGQFPFIGSLQYKTHDNPNGTHMCGAVLIDKKWALTAAHCLSPLYPSKVVFGDINLNQKSPSHHESRILVAPHEYYNDSSFENDIALIAIRDDVKDYNQDLSEVPLASSSNEISLYEKCFVAGWGYSSGGNNLPDALQYAEVKLVNPFICLAKWWDFNPTLMICAQSYTSDSCQGDSGGPLVCSKKSSSSLELVGIVSYGVNVCMPGDPGVYTRVSAFQEWIAQNESTKPFLTIPLLPITIMFGYQLLEHYYSFILS